MQKLPNQNTPVLYQGITSSLGAVHTEMALVYGTNIVAGVAREKGLKTYLNVPVFQTVKEAVRKTKPEISVIFSTPARALSDVSEAIKAKIPLIICTTEHVPLHDALQMKQLAAKSDVQLLGPSSPGIVTVGKCLAGAMPAHLFEKGTIGIVTRSSSMAYEAARQLSQHGLGISACIALGTAPITGTDFIPAVKVLLSDARTKAILMIGDYAGLSEVEFAKWYQSQKRQKPLAAYIGGKAYGKSKKTPLLGCENKLPAKSVSEKQEALKGVSAHLILSPEMLGSAMAELLTKEV